MKDDKQIESVKRYEISKHRKPKDVRGEGRGFDIESSGRLIEVKGRDFPKRKFIFITEKEFGNFLKNKNSWLYIVPNSGGVIEIERDMVLKAATIEPRWRISLRNEISGI